MIKRILKRRRDKLATQVALDDAYYNAMALGTGFLMITHDVSTGEFRLESINPSHVILRGLTKPDYAGQHVIYHNPPKIVQTGGWTGVKHDSGG